MGLIKRLIFLNIELGHILDDLYRKGQEHDIEDRPHDERMLNITPDTGTFLSLLIRATQSRNILEIGTSNGYSTIWLADAASITGGTVTTVEVSEDKFAMAKDNFRMAGLAGQIKQELRDVRTFIGNIPDSSVDFLFLDADRTQYADYWSEIDRVLGKNRLLVVDNALAPKPEELIPLKSLIEGSRRYLSQILEIGKGELVALKISSPE